jgi:ABC-2 type transport system permease protein
MAALTGLLWRNHATRGRVAAVGVVGALLVSLAVAILFGDGGASAALDLVEIAGLALLVPVGAVVFATSVLGDPAEDGTLGYLLNTPRPRWRLAGAAYAATAATVVPLVVVPLAVALLLNAVSPATVAAVSGAAALGAAAYCAVFMALGVRFQRALLFGLLYTAIWEGVVAGFGTGLARLSVRQYVTSLMAGLRGEPVPDAGVSTVTAAVVLIGLVVVGLAVTTGLLRRHISRA